jgi:Bacteriophage tail sheath protein
MPAELTYPGVYVEEVPSEVRTITPVSTSVTAFVGFTSRGPTDRARQIFNTGDFEREFGGLSADGDLGHAVQQYFQNGGARAWIVRVAAGAAPAGITLRSGPAGGAQNVLDVEAASEGSWGNRVRLDVDYDTANPASLFNLTVTEFAEENGVLTAVRSEVHRNLSMNGFAPNAAPATVNAASELIRVERDPAATGLVGTAQGTSESGDLTGTDFTQLNDDRRRLAITIDGDGPYEFDLFDAGGSIAGADENARIADVADRIQTRVRLLKPADPAFADFTAERDGKEIVATSGEDGETSSVRFTNASLRNAAVLLKLGLLNGGREADAAALMRPAQTGTVSASLAGVNLGSLPANASINVTVQVGSTSVGPESVPLWAVAADRPTTLEQLRAKVQAALAAESIPELAGAKVTLVDDRLRIEAGGDPNARLMFADGTTADPIGLSAAGGGIVNVADYSLGVGISGQAQVDPVPGADGTAPTIGDLRGSRAQKTGLFALEEVDIFNLLCLPGISDPALLADAIAYCEERRAFCIVDLPAATDTLDDARQWLTENGSLRHKNAAAYFPQFLAPDPVQNFRTRAFSPSGAVAGIYARTDTNRGVWKAPAGTDAVVRGARGLAYTLTDPENGVLNPLGLNSLRTFPVFGPVVWGSRTLVGADQLASEWKYVPVRRTALFIEESLFRGTKWVVFEPNDETLWAQIRLNIGAFMQTLFRQGAFQGTSAREAYFVKCDNETTTQNDIDRGIVNIVVGFAPLKPVEFVVIRFQQKTLEAET